MRRLWYKAFVLCFLTSFWPLLVNLLEILAKLSIERTLVHLFLMFLVLSTQIRPFCQKCQKVTPKRSPKDSQIEDVRPLTTNSIYSTESSFSHLRRALGAHFFYTASWTLLFVFVCNFWDYPSVTLTRSFLFLGLGAFSSGTLAQELSLGTLA